MSIIKVYRFCLFYSELTWGGVNELTMVKILPSVGDP